MKLVSSNDDLFSCKCGVVLDKDKLRFAEEPFDLLYMSETERKAAGWMWDYEEAVFTPFALCPVCGRTVTPDS